MRSFFDEAVAAAQAQDASLRLRLAINPGAAELHNLRWETLRLPDSDAPLLTGQNFTFSRYLSSLDWRPVRLRPEAELRALVVVADPSDVQRVRLAPVDRENELAAAHAGLGEIAATELATRGQVTLNNIAAPPARRLRHPLPGGPRHAGGGGAVALPGAGGWDSGARAGQRSW